MLFGPAWGFVQAIKLRPRVVHLHDPELIPWAVGFRLLGIKVIFDSHEDIAATMLYKPYLNPVARTGAIALVRALVWFVEHVATGIVAATPTIASTYRSRNTCVVQNFPILGHWTKAPLRPTARQLVYVGGISEVRGAWQMLESIDRLGRTHGASLALAGPVAADLLGKMRRHPGWARVRYLGVLDQPEVARLLRESTVGVALLLPEPNYLNSQPTKMFEYMAAELPVLASDFPLWRRFVVDSHAGVVADPTVVDDIVEAAGALLDDPDGAATMGRRGRRLVEAHYNWDSEARTMLRFYADLLDA
jgi:glycosyltransferase involved in cell wall biosynthesis